MQVGCGRAGAVSLLHFAAAWLVPRRMILNDFPG
jgi:hypothetical protein